MSIPATCPQCQTHFDVLSDAPPKRPSPRSPFPWSSIVIVAIGLLFLLLFISVGFNVWLLQGPEHRYGRMMELENAQRAAEQQRVMAEQQRLMAQQVADEKARLQLRWNDLKRENDQLRQQLLLLGQPKEEAKK